MKNNSKGVQGRIIYVDGIKFQIIDGKLFRYADLTLDKGFKIVLGRIGSEKILMDLRTACLD